MSMSPAEQLGAETSNDSENNRVHMIHVMLLLRPISYNAYIKQNNIEIYN